MTEGPQEYTNDIHPATQFLYLVLVIIVGIIAWLLISTGLIMLIYGLSVFREMGTFGIDSPPEVINALKLFQSLTSVFIFMAPPVVFGYWVVKEPKSYIKATTRLQPQLLLLVLAIMFLSSPFMEWLININQKMMFPGFLKGVYQWMRNSEDEAIKTTEVLLTMKTTAGLLVNMIMIAVLPAIAEEFLFRGAIQTIFTRWTNNPHWGIWIAAILFSAVHMEFFGFLPRLLLGVFFGYFVFWSGSIWTSVWGHFINNGTAVIVTYLYQQKKITLNPDNQHVFNYGAYAFSLIITVFLFFVYKRVAESKKSLPGW